MKSRKIISTILASAMVFGLVPGFVFADETEETDIPEIVIEEEEPEEAEPEEEILEEEVTPEEPEEEEQAEEIAVEESDEDEVEDAAIIDLGSCGDNATCTYDADTKTLTISGEGEMYSYWSDDTPWDDYHREIENLVIEEGITNVSEEAFLDCEQLSSITLPDTLLTIDDGAFSWCESLVSITIPDSVTTINGFDSCTSLEEVFFGENSELETISGGAFSNCESLTTFTIPSSVTYIGFDAFQSCTSLQDVYCYADPGSLSWDDYDIDSYMPDKGTTVHVYSEVLDCYLNNFTRINVTFAGDLEYFGDPACGDDAVYSFDPATGTLTISGTGEMYDYESAYDIPWYSYKDEITSIVVEEGITSIGINCFFTLGSVQEISLPDGLTGIGICAFYWCDDITEITLPDTLEYIGEGAFGLCAGVTDVYFYVDPADLTWDTLDGYDNFKSDSATKLHVCYGCADAFASKFPGLDVTYVEDRYQNPCGDHAYYSFDDVTGTLTISGSGEMYDYNSFGDSPWYSIKDDITSIVVDEDITSIGDHCFKDLGNVETVSLPDGLTEIGICAFFWCDDLTEIELPDTLEFIGADAFGMCFGVTDVYCYMDPENLTWDTHQGYNNFQEDSATRLHIYYDYADDFASKFPDLDITYVTDRYVNACGDTCGWTYDEDTKTLTIVGTGDMWDYNYNSYDGSGAAPWYKDYAYEMEKIVISDGIERIGDCAFLYCMYATEVVVPDSVTEIGKKAFFTCYRIPEIYIPDGVSSIGDSAFANCIAIEEVTIPASVVSIGEGAFSGCDKLKTVNIEKDSLLQSIGNWAFSSCDLLECIELPESVQFIGASAFYYCESMSYIVITSDPSELEWDVNNSYLDFKEDGTTECRVPWRYYQDYVDNFSYINTHFVGNLVYLSINDTENGTVNNTSGYATYRDTYTLDIVPDQGYVVDTITVTKQNGDTVEVDMSDYSFKVPGTEEATVTVTFKEASGWIKGIDGTYNYYENGTKVTGWKKISGKYYFFNDDGVMQTGWLKDGKKWYYLTSNGDMVTGWKQISKKWYYFNAAGDMVTGWKKIGSKYYFFNTSGAMQTGWLKEGTKYYYLGTDGAMVTGWQKVSGKWYYFNAGGDMVTGWKKIGTKWYYFQSSGAMQTANLTYKGKVYYFNSDGSCKNP